MVSGENAAQQVVQSELTALNSSVSASNDLGKSLKKSDKSLMGVRAEGSS